MPVDPVVHVVDDDDAARDSLAFLLKSAEFSVRTHVSAVAFLDAFPDAESGCVITDVRMPEIDGVELLRRLRHQKSNFPVIVVTGGADVSRALEAMRAGAIDFIEKPYRDEVLLGAVRMALSTPDATGSTRDREKAEIQERLATLSAIERQVFDALVAGQSNQSIAVDLQIDKRAIEIHRASVMTKMQANSLSHLVRMTLLTGS